MVFTIACEAKQTKKYRKEPELFVGMKVLRKADKHLCIGTVLSVGETRAQIRWDAGWRIGGGYLTRNIKLPASSLIEATPEAVLEKRISIRFINVKAAQRELMTEPSSFWLESNNLTHQEWQDRRAAKIVAKVKVLIEAGRQLLELKH